MTPELERWLATLDPTGDPLKRPKGYVVPPMEKHVPRQGVIRWNNQWLITGVEYVETDGQLTPYKDNS